jgi:hypothetical protein
MNVTTYYPEKEYPYLAIWVGKNETLDLNSIKNIKKEDIVLISMARDDEGNEQPYVQNLLGGGKGYFTKSEDEYCPLPKGYSVTICQ